MEHTKSDSLPQLLRCVGPFDGLDVEVHTALVFPDGGVSRVGQWARRAVAQAGNIVLVSAEVLFNHLRLVTAVSMVDDLQNMRLPDGKLKSNDENVNIGPRRLSQRQSQENILNNG